MQLTPGAEVNPNPAPPANASGAFLITVNVTRDTSGNVTAGAINFLGTVNFPGGAAITVVGLHIHEGDSLTNAPVVFNTGLSGSNPMALPTGVGLINLNAQSVDLAVLGRLLARPSGFYVNLHTSVNPGGAIRGQITRLVETSSNTVAMTTAQEVMPPAPLPANASGTGTITVNPVRNPLGVITGGTVTFTIQFDLPAGSVIRGLHIHRGIAGANGGVEIDTRLSGTNTVTTATGSGTISLEVPITSAPSDAVALAAMRDLLVNPAGFYVNLHTNANTAGVIRGQLAAIAAPPVIQQSNTYFLETGATNAPIVLFVTGIDLASSIRVNGQPVTAGLDVATGALNVIIPAALRANAGTLFVQARNGAGLMSAPLQIVVAPAASVNAFPITTTDAAKFGALAAPEAIVAGFGTRLASQTASATGQPLPTALDGTSIFVNGLAARLFFVSGNQANYQIPAATGTGPAAVVAVARDGTVSRGQLNVSQSAPAIFTMTANGVGAPAAVASTDGTNFNLLLGNPDGTPREIGAGNFVMLFGTALRFGSTATTNAIKIG
ncbi:MAG: CHRD domain-containing protein, partial [Blastocatellia bacterium]